MPYEAKEECTRVRSKNEPLHVSWADCTETFAVNKQSTVSVSEL